MKRIHMILFLILVALVLVGCTPTVSINNNTSFPVRVLIFSKEGHQMFSPSPGYSSTAEVSQGPWTAAVIPDLEWIEYAKQMRQYLNERIANSQNLTGQELLDTIQQLKDIAARMQSYEQAAQQTLGSSCSGTINDEVNYGEVNITTDANGVLIASCK